MEVHLKWKSNLPDFLHIVPVGNNTVLDGVFKGQNTSLRLSFISYVRVFLAHTDHDSLMSRSTDDRGKDLIALRRGDRKKKLKRNGK